MVFRTAGKTTYWTRPGKGGGVSASTGHCRGPSGNDLLYVFSSSAAPFEPELSYSRFAAYTLLYHHADFRSATLRVGSRGLWHHIPNGGEELNNLTREPVLELTMTPAPGKPGRFITIATADGSEVHRDAIDPNGAVSRRRFVGATMRAAFKGLDPDEWPNQVREKLESELLRQCAVPPGPAELPVRENENGDPRIDPLAKMPIDVRAEAERKLHSPDLMDVISEDIERLGVVGEAKNRLILYLVGTSAQLRRPLAAIARGSSSSGKSFLCERISRLFPAEVVLHATGMTTNALYYFEPGTLKHRFIVAGERSRVQDDEQAEATRVLREMIEGGLISKALPVKEGDRMVTKQVVQEGPISYLESTTLNMIFEEDANRCLLLNTDEGSEQTRRISAPRPHVPPDSGSRESSECVRFITPCSGCCRGWRFTSRSRRRLRRISRMIGSKAVEIFGTYCIWCARSLCCISNNVRAARTGR